MAYTAFNIIFSLVYFAQKQTVSFYSCIKLKHIEL